MYMNVLVEAIILYSELTASKCELQCFKATLDLHKFDFADEKLISML